MTEKMDMCVFGKLCEPLLGHLNELAESMPEDKEKYKLSLVPFTVNLIYAAICRIRTIGRLVTEIKTTPTAGGLGLVDVSKSMYSEAIRSYRPGLFRKMFGHLLISSNFLAIPEINALRGWCSHTLAERDEKAKTTTNYGILTPTSRQWNRP